MQRPGPRQRPARRHAARRFTCDSWTAPRTSWTGCMGTCPKPRTGRKRPPLSRSIRSATRPSTRWRAASGRAGPPCSCNDAQATTPCTSPPRPVRPGHPLAGVVLRLRLPRRAPLPPDPPRRPAPALWDLVDPHLSWHRPRAAAVQRPTSHHAKPPAAVPPPDTSCPTARQAGSRRHLQARRCLATLLPTTTADPGVGAQAEPQARAAGPTSLHLFEGAHHVRQPTSPAHTGP